MPVPCWHPQLWSRRGGPRRAKGPGADRRTARLAGTTPARHDRWAGAGPTGPGRGVQRACRWAVAATTVDTTRRNSPADPLAGNGRHGRQRLRRAPRGNHAGPRPTPQIVVGIDDSAASRAALRWAAAQALLTGAPAAGGARLQMSELATAAIASRAGQYWEAAAGDARSRAARWVLDTTLDSDGTDLRWTLDIVEGAPGAVLVSRSAGGLSSSCSAPANTPGCAVRSSARAVEPQQQHTGTRGPP